MELATDSISWEDTPSDNSHLFGRPVSILEGYDATLIVKMPREECFQHIENGDFIPFQRANLDIRCDYIRE